MYTALFVVRGLKDDYVLTDEGFFFVLVVEPVAAREERIRIGAGKPVDVAHVHAQPHLQINLFVR